MLYPQITQIDKNIICAICGLSWLFADDVFGFLVFAQALKRRVADDAFVSPLGEGDFTNIFRLGPHRASQVGIFRDLFEWSLVHDDLV